MEESTIVANACFLESIVNVHKTAATMGMGGIMSAKNFAYSKQTEKNVNKAFLGYITPEVPASILQLHPDVTVIYSEN